MKEITGSAPLIERGKPFNKIKGGVKSAIYHGFEAALRLAGPRRIGRLTGLDVRPLRLNHHYVPDYYGATARKHIDIRALPEFAALASDAISKKRTLLYYDRLYTIYQSLAGVKRLVRSHEEINIAEVGVYRGGTSHFIASATQALGIEHARLHSFDTFEGHPPKDVDAGLEPLQPANSFNDTQFETVRDYLSEFDNISVHKGRIQDTASEIKDKRFHLLHLDVDIYEPTAFALKFFGERLVAGGVIVVDDYGFVSCPGAKKAVDEFTEASRNFFSLHLLTGQCVLVKHQ